MAIEPYRLSTRAYRRLRNSPEERFVSDKGNKEFRSVRWNGKFLLTQVLSWDGNRLVASGERAILRDSPEVREQLYFFARNRGCPNRATTYQ